MDTTDTTHENNLYVNVGYLVMGFISHPNYVELVECYANKSGGEVDLIEQVGKYAEHVQLAFDDVTIDREYGDHIFAYEVVFKIGLSIADFVYELAGKLPPNERVFDETWELTKEGCRVAEPG
jgi:hypothetical protein